MIGIFFPNSRAIRPTFRINCPDGSHVAQMGSHFAQNTTTKPCSLLSIHKPLFGICTYTKHPPTLPQNTPFPDLILKVGKMHSLGKMDPIWAKLFKKWAKKFIHPNNRQIDLCAESCNLTDLWQCPCYCPFEEFKFEVALPDRDHLTRFSVSSVCLSCFLLF